VVAGNRACKRGLKFVAPIVITNSHPKRKEKVHSSFISSYLKITFFGPKIRETKLKTEGKNP
jgi:hypothetical protein